MATKKARRVVKTDLEVGQRWQFGNARSNLDSTIIKIEGESVYAHDDETPWDVGTFRANHQRLRVGMPAHARDPRPSPTETVTYYGEVTGLELYPAGMVSVTWTRNSGTERIEDLSMRVPRAECPELGDVCKVTFSKPEVV